MTFRPGSGAADSLGAPARPGAAARPARPDLKRGPVSRDRADSESQPGRVYPTGSAPSRRRRDFEPFAANPSQIANDRLATHPRPKTLQRSVSTGPTSP